MRCEHAPEVFENPVQIAGCKYFIYKHPAEGHRYISVREYNKRYGVPQKWNARKEVYQYSLNKEFINRFDGVKEAAKATGVSRSSIWTGASSAVFKPRKFIWSYTKLESIRKGNWKYSNRDFLEAV